MGALEKVRHAFAVDPPGPAEPTPEQQPVVDRICREIARRGLTVPGLIAMELSRPLNFIASQALHMVSPAIWAIAREESHENYKGFAAFLEQRGSIDYFIARVEHFEDEFDRRERAAKEARRNPASAESETGAHGPEEDHDQD